jgi:large subunit ribosomal protein L15
MKLHDLQPRAGAHRKRKRVGHGIAAGQGKTAGRGTKGEGARAGSGGKIYRQGGNLPFFRRLPFKRGFTNISRATWNEVNLSRLSGFPAQSEISPETLGQAGLLRAAGDPIVVLGMGEISVPLTVKVHRVSKTARAKIEAAGGRIELIAL